MSTKLPGKINNWLLFGQFWLLPATCLVCNQPGDFRKDLCLACLNRFPRVDRPCLGCGLPLPPAIPDIQLCGGCDDKRYIYRTVAPLKWDPEVIPLISGFKYHQQLVAGVVLGQILELDIHKHYAGIDLPQLLVPVPLHYKRLQERGYNQALLLARQLARAFAIPVAHNMVERIRSTPPQQGLNAKARKQNLRGAFGISHPQLLHGIKRIALIDDVVTTMATVRILARMLQGCSPEPLEIHVWALARA